MELFCCSIGGVARPTFQDQLVFVRDADYHTRTTKIMLEFTFPSNADDLKGYFKDIKGRLYSKCSVNFDATENSHVECKRTGHTYKAHHAEQSETGQPHVAKVHDVGGESVGLELLEVDNRVQKDINGG